VNGKNEEAGHACRYVERLVWSPWRPSGRIGSLGEMEPPGALVERVARRVPVCVVCGHERPARRPRPVVRREMRAEIPEAPPLVDADGRAVAAVLARARGASTGPADRPVPIAGLLGDLARRDIPASLAEEWIERYLRAGWLTATWRLGGMPQLAWVVLLQPEALAELAWPGAEGRRRAALDAARERTAPLAHPKAREIAALLASPEAESFPPVLAEALAALAVHAEAGEPLAERVFAARYLGGSKALAPLRERLERLVGPLAGIGIREGASVTLLGGAGTLHLARGELDLVACSPFVGLARETVESLQGIAFPAAGLFAVENFAAFEACCRGEVAAARGALVAWSAGYPGRALRRLVELAGERGAPLTVWADLDLDGVRIARLLAGGSPAGATFFRMAPADVAAAPRRHPLSARSIAAIRRDLAERPEAPLVETLQALLDAGSWVEQEAFLAGG
jgi:uncharacterized protein DUF2399